MFVGDCLEGISRGVMGKPVPWPHCKFIKTKSRVLRKTKVDYLSDEEDRESPENVCFLKRVQGLSLST
jgi:hypothetical protein